MANKKNHYFFKSLKYLKPYKGYTFICLLSCIIATGMSVLFPFYTQKILTAFANESGKELLVAAVMLVIFTVGHSIVHMLLWGTTADRLRAKVTKNIRYNTMQSIVNLKTRNFDNYGSGKLLQTVTSDTEQLSNVYVEIVDVGTSLLAKLAIYIYIFAMNFWLGIYCLIEFVVVCLVYHIRLNARVKDRLSVKDKIDKNTGLIAETIRGVRDIKNYNIQDEILKKTDESLKQLECIDAKYGTKQYQLFRVTVITRDLFAFLFIPLALILIKYNITTFAIAFTAFVFRNSALSAIDWLMSTLEKIKDGGIYAERIFHVIDGYHEGFEDFPTEDKFKKLPQKLSVEVKNLSFSYSGETEVLKNFNLSIDYGSKIAIVGESGVGKSTILKLLNKTYDVNRGHIFIGNQDICDFSKNTLRNIITIVPQDPYIFNFSIYQNLEIVSPKANKKEIINACKKAQIYDFIMSLPNGFDTVLGEAGTRLSGGQKQRLAIARAFLKNSPILIFDETTSALDNENQNKIKKAIDSIGRNKIVIIVAHRLSTIIDSDIIYFMKDGTIVSSGNHQTLLKKCKDYKKLYQKENT